MSNKQNSGVFDHKYLFSGYIKANGNPIKNSIEPIANTIVFSEDATVKGADKLVAWSTNKNGELSLIGHSDKGDAADRNTAHFLARQKRFYIPPPELNYLSYGAFGNSWGKRMGEAIAESGIAPITLTSIEIKAADLDKALRKPLPKPSDSAKDKDADYRKWYDEKIKNGKSLYGYLLPEVRAIFFCFSSPLFDGATLKVWEPNKSKSLHKFIDEKLISPVKKVDNNSIYLTGYFAPKKDLQPGIYTVEVTIDDAVAKRNGFVETRTSERVFKNKSYTFKAKVDFNLTNGAGSYDVVICDPISVEESLLTQFPTEYVHLVSAAKQINVDKSQLDPKLKGQIPADSSELRGLQHWAKRTQLTKDAMEIVSGYLGLDSKSEFALMLGNHLWAMINSSTDPHFTPSAATKDLVEFAFAIKSYQDKVKDLRSKILELFLEAINGDENMDKVSTYYIKEAFRLFGEKSARKRSWLNTRATDIDIKEYAQTKLAIIKAENSRALNKSLLKMIGKRIDDFTGPAGDLLSVYMFGSNAYDTMVDYGKQSKNEERLKVLLGQYDKVVGEDVSAANKGDAINNRVYYPIKDGIAHIEKYRNITTLGHMGLDKRALELADQAYDMVTLGLCCSGIGTKVGIALAVAKGVYELAKIGYGGVKSLGGALDGFLLNSYFTEKINSEKFQKEIENRSVANQTLLNCSIEKTDIGSILDTQYRIRAEALYGLMGLIIRAAIAAGRSEKFSDYVEKYKIEQYIRNFVLNDGWIYPTTTFTPINLDTHWMYMINQGGYVSESSLESVGLNKDFLLIKDADKTEDTGNAHDITDEEIASYNRGIVPGARYVLTFFDRGLADTVKTEFQKCFPIEMLESDSINDLAQTFKPIFTELDGDCLQKNSCVFPATWLKK